ncbi:hypothetical protein [Bifidobacterium sp. SO1]|uniref:hypothetical protein n=1 Tax=Bifidobacterium sp. SO1 TaxID=2809029 RepID=UPI001BDDA7F0|nr:hypothetical protein [Bifidobacterium sp. SO1]MBT1161846.1 hypothetical protein [Bifidobacterium sp. SO1]
MTFDDVTVRRMLNLADRRREGPKVTVDERAQTALWLGCDPGEAKRHGMRVDERLPLLARDERIRDDLDAARLQIAYRTIQTGFARRTDASRRLGLLQEGAIPDGSGALCVSVCGLLTGYARADWRMGRICLTSPTVVFGRNGRVVDSHLWLDVRNLTPGLSGVEPPKDLRIGDLITVTGRLMGYSDANGSRRFGLGEWEPTGARLMYGCGRGLKPRIVHVPRHLTPHMIVCRLDDGRAEWADPYALDLEIREWEERFPDASTDLRLGGGR